MASIFRKISKENQKQPIVYVIDKQSDISKLGLSSASKTYVKAQFTAKHDLVLVEKFPRCLFVAMIKEKNQDKKLEKYRVLGSKIADQLNHEKNKDLQVSGNDTFNVVAIAEGAALANYQFLKYFKDKGERKNALSKIGLHCADLKSVHIKNLEAVVQAVYKARDLVNEPLSFLTAPQLAKEIKAMGKEASFKVEVLNKKKIEALKMGGVLAVNKGSIDPPTFSILEWKPKNAKNKKPVVLVGKGVVYDTGGLSLKPTANSMDMMKCDMAGAAMMASTIYAVAKAELPVHVIGLIPATDNRPGLNAYAPGDVVKMHNGLTVEVLNTDAEGRMLLADALSFAKKYKPELVIDSATLTGAAVRSIGIKASCVMGTASEKVFDSLDKSGHHTHERLARMPFWEDYKDSLKSDVADINNLGNGFAGQITAGKFLEHFIDYPWVHIDIAGPAYINARDGYRTKWGTGVGVRLLFNYFLNR